MTKSKPTITKQQFVTLVLLALSLVIFTGSLYIYQASRPKVYEYGIYKPGTEIASGEVMTTVNSFRSEQGSGQYTAPEGKKYLILEVSFKNNSDKTVAILPSTQTYIKTDDGKVYFLTPYALEQPLRAGDLKPDDIITGELSYLVPEGSSYTMYIDSIWSGGVVSVRLT